MEVIIFLAIVCGALFILNSLGSKKEIFDDPQGMSNHHLISAIAGQADWLEKMNLAPLESQQSPSIIDIAKKRRHYIARLCLEVVSRGDVQSVFTETLQKYRQYEVGGLDKENAALRAVKEVLFVPNGLFYPTSWEAAPTTNVRGPVFLIEGINRPLTPSEYGYISAKNSIGGIEQFAENIKSYMVEAPPENEISLIELLLNKHRLFLELNYIAYDLSSYINYPLHYLNASSGFIDEFMKGAFNGIAETQNVDQGELNGDFNASLLEEVRTYIQLFNEEIVSDNETNLVNFNGNPASQHFINKMVGFAQNDRPSSKNFAAIELTMLPILLMTEAKAVIETIQDKFKLSYIR